MLQPATAAARAAVSGDLPPDVSVLAAADPSCTECSGQGTITNRRGRRTCGCVCRRVFRACLACYERCQAAASSSGQFVYERVGSMPGRSAIVPSSKRAEFAADFVLTARRALADRPIERAVFESVHLQNQPWFEAVPRINRGIGPLQRLNRGSFFHAVYRTEEIIGKAILVARPYRLYPTRQYFAGYFLRAADLVLARMRPR